MLYLGTLVRHDPDEGLLVRWDGYSATDPEYETWVDEDGDDEWAWAEIPTVGAAVGGGVVLPALAPARRKRLQDTMAEHNKSNAIPPTLVPLVLDAVLKEVESSATLRLLGKWQVSPLPPVWPSTLHTRHRKAALVRQP